MKTQSAFVAVITFIKCAQFPVVCYSFVLPQNIIPVLQPGATRRTLPISLTSRRQEDKEPDLLEYFDPLLSPHAYPKGISSGGARNEHTVTPSLLPKENVRDTNDDADDDLYDPMGWKQTFSSNKSNKKKSFKPFGIELPSTEDTGDMSSGTANGARPLVDTSTTFDPTLSPHAYAKGVPDVIVGDENTAYISDDHTANKILGVLLIDHGSRNEASNFRLHELAQLYQKSAKIPATSVIVKAAHMEIATPSIQDGIDILVQAGVDEIICHPYFLSPGRHVKEDIPRIVAAAIETLSVEIPVRTTEPLGSVTDIMIGVIHSLVQETSDLNKSYKN